MLTAWQSDLVDRVANLREPVAGQSRPRSGRRLTTGPAGSLAQPGLAFLLLLLRLLLRFLVVSLRLRRRFTQRPAAGKRLLRRLDGLAALARHAAAVPVRRVIAEPLPQFEGGPVP